MQNFLVVILTAVANDKKCFFLILAVVEAQLVDHSIPIPEVCRSDQVIGKSL